MPCYVQETQEEKDASAYNRFKHNSPLAEWLCTIFKEVPVDALHEVVGVLPNEAIEWWMEHKERDRNKENK